MKSAAERAGRDPDSVRVWSVFATLSDELPADELLRRSVGRLATYLQVYGDLLVRTNNWDPAALTRSYEYYDPIRTLPPAGQRWWAEHAVGVLAASAPATGA